MSIELLIRTLSGTGELVNGFGCLSELSLQLCQLEPSLLQFFVFIRNTSSDETKTVAGLAAGPWGWLVSEITFNEGTQFLVAH